MIIDFDTLTAYMMQPTKPVDVASVILFALQIDLITEKLDETDSAFNLTGCPTQDN